MANPLDGKEEKKGLFFGAQLVPLEKEVSTRDGKKKKEEGKKDRGKMESFHPFRGTNKRR